MLTTVCLVPSTPLLVPELGGAAGRAGGPDDAAAPLRARVHAVAAALAERADRWVVVGQGERAEARHDAVSAYPEPAREGTFAGFGCDVRVPLGETGGDVPAASGDPAAPADPRAPLPLLVAGLLRGALPPGLRPAPALTGLRAGCAAAPQECAEAGRRLRARLDAAPGRTGVLVVADGPDSLTATAPGAYDERALPVAEAVASAVAGGDAAALAALDPALCAGTGLDGRAALQVMGALAGAGPRAVEHASAEWPYGVAYYTGLWVL